MKSLSSKTWALLPILLFLLSLLVPESNAVYQTPLPPAPHPTEQGRVRIGESVPISLNLKPNSPRQIIHHPDASFIKLHFAQLKLVAGDTILVTDATGTERLVYPDGSGPNRYHEFWATTITGDTAIVTLRPGTAGNNSSVLLDSYIWGYPINRFSDLLAPASSCGMQERLDSICYTDSYSTEVTQAAAVALLLGFDDQEAYFCTTWRVTPDNFLLTNQHCLDSQAELDQAEIWFNYRRPLCLEVGVPAESIVKVKGDRLLLRDHTLDFALFTVRDFESVIPFGYLELDPRPPKMGEQIYIPQYGDGGPQQLAIESDLNPPSYLCQIDQPVRDGRGLATDSGYFCDTATGSSGSPVLARSSHQVIALHHYGLAPDATCNTKAMNAGVRIDQIWPLVEPFLAPSDILIQTTPSHLFACQADMTELSVSVHAPTSPVTLATPILPPGVEATFSPSQGISPFTSQLTLSTGQAPAGSYTFTLSALTEGSSWSQTLPLTINDQLPAAPIVQPLATAAHAPTLPVFAWTPAGEAAFYEIEVAADPDFSDLLLSETVTDTQYVPAQPLPNATQLYWRVRASNGCGPGPYTLPQSLTTATCVAPSLPIPDGTLSGASSTLYFSEDVPAGSLSVFLKVDHEWVGDLRFELEHVESQTQLILVDRPGVDNATLSYGCDGQGINALLEDSAPLLVDSECTDSQPSIAGVFRPHDRLGTFRGQSLTGHWRLTAIDEAPRFTGTIQQWCMAVTPAETPQLLYLPLLTR